MSNFVGAAEIVLRRKFIALSAYIRKLENKEGLKEMTQVITFRNQKKNNQMNQIELEGENNKEQKSR